jgi:hypothetical protein
MMPSEHHRDRMLGGGDGVAEGRVHDDDAVSRRGLDIDVVDADAGAADDFQTRRDLQQLLRHLGRRADGETVIAADDGAEIGGRKAGLHIGVDTARAKNLDGGGRQLIGDEYLGGHARYSAACVDV